LLFYLADGITHGGASVAQLLDFVQPRSTALRAKRPRRDVPALDLGGF